MALVSCRECGKRVSDEAQTCPHCGITNPAPPPTPPSATRGYVWIAIIVAVIAVVVIGSQSKPGPSTPAPSVVAPAPTVDKSPEKQKARTELITKLQGLRVFGEYRCRTSGATLEVRPAFMALDFKDKQQFASVVWAHCFDGTEKYVSVSLVDVRTGKDVGTFSAENGLRME